MGRACSTYGETRNAYRSFGGKYIEMILREIGWCSMDWIHLAQDRDQWRALVNMVMNLRVP
jgi:hypothetical protein